jgi:hypothetical protein
MSGALLMSSKVTPRNFLRSAWRVATRALSGFFVASGIAAATPASAPTNHNVSQQPQLGISFLMNNSAVVPTTEAPVAYGRISDLYIEAKIRAPLSLPEPILELPPIDMHSIQEAAVTPLRGGEITANIQTNLATTAKADAIYREIAEAYVTADNLPKTGIMLRNQVMRLARRMMTASNVSPETLQSEAPSIVKLREALVARQNRLLNRLYSPENV